MEKVSRHWGEAVCNMWTSRARASGGVWDRSTHFVKVQFQIGKRVELNGQTGLVEKLLPFKEGVFPDVGQIPCFGPIH